MEPTLSLDAQALKALIKESVREVMHEEWFKFFDLLIPYVDNEEQAEIAASFSPTDHPDTDFVDILERLLALNLELAAKEKRGEAIVGCWALEQ